LERDQVIQVGSWRGIEKFEGEIENFILNTFFNFKPVKRFENRNGVSEFRSFNNGTSKGVLDLLETMYLRKIVVPRVTVVKFGMYYGGCNDTGCWYHLLMFTELTTNQYYLLLLFVTIMVMDDDEFDDNIVELWQEHFTLSVVNTSETVMLMFGPTGR